MLLLHKDYEDLVQTNAYEIESRVFAAKPAGIYPETTPVRV